MTHLPPKGPPAPSARLSPKAVAAISDRIKEIDLTLQAHVMQPSMERQLEHEKLLLQAFYSKYCV